MASGCSGFAGGVFGVAQLRQAAAALDLGLTGRDSVADGLGGAGMAPASPAGASASEWWQIWVGPQLHSGCIREEKQHIFISSLSSIAKCLATMPRLLESKNDTHSIQREAFLLMPSCYWGQPKGVLSTPSSSKFLCRRQILSSQWASMQLLASRGNII
jgi:hypothetical protein